MRKIIDDIKNLALKKGIIEKEETKKPDGIETILVLRFPPGRKMRLPIAVVFPKDESFFVLDCKITISPEHTLLLPTRSAQDKRNFKEELMKTALQVNCAYSIQFKPPPPNSENAPLPFFGLQRTLPFDKFEETSFMDAYRQLGTAIDLMVMRFIDIIVKEIPPEKHENDQDTSLYS